MLKLGPIVLLAVATAAAGSLAPVLSSVEIAAGGSNSECQQSRSTRERRQLPSPILAAYANWGQCDEKLVQAARDGVNVLIW